MNNKFIILILTIISIGLLLISVVQYMTIVKLQEGKEACDEIIEIIDSWNDLGIEL